MRRITGNEWGFGRYQVGSIRPHPCTTAWEERTLSPTGSLVYMFSCRWRVSDKQKGVLVRKKSIPLTLLKCVLAGNSQERHLHGPGAPASSTWKSRLAGSRESISVDSELAGISHGSFGMRMIPTWKQMVGSVRNTRSHEASPTYSVYTDLHGHSVFICVVRLKVRGAREAAGRYLSPTTC